MKYCRMGRAFEGCKKGQGTTRAQLVGQEGRAWEGWHAWPASERAGGPGLALSLSLSLA